jgi:hypothetical protein
MSRRDGRIELSPGVATTLRRSRRHARLLVLLGLVFLALSVGLAGAARHQRDEYRGWLHARGHVVSVEGCGGCGVANVEYESAGRVRTTSARWDDSRDRYVTGESVEVVIDPTDANRVVVLPSMPLSYVLFVVIPAALAAVTVLLIAGIVLVRIGRQRRVLLRSPLRSAAARWVPVHGRGRLEPRFVIEQRDGSWRVVRPAATSLVRTHANQVLQSGVIDVAEAGAYVVLRAAPLGQLLLAKVEELFDPSALPADSAALVAVAAGAQVPVDPTRRDDAPWFRESRRNVAMSAARFFVAALVVLAALFRLAVTREPANVLIAPSVVAAVVLGPVLALPSRTVTTVDHRGLVHKTGARAARVIGFEHIAKLVPFPAERPNGPVKVAVALDDGTVVVIVTRRPDELLSALRRARAFA